MKGLVLAVESRGRPTVAQSARKPDGGRRTGRDIAAAAMLEFDIDAAGVCRAFALNGVDERTAGESAVVAVIDRRLEALRMAGGRLVTCDGQLDLELVRLATLRHRQFSNGAASTWLRDDGDAHDDVLLMASPARPIRAVRRPEIVRAIVGPLTWNGGGYQGPARRERIDADLRVLETMVVYLHLLSERHRSPDPLSRGVSEMADMLLVKVRTAPHLLPILQSKMFRWSTSVF